MSPEAALAYRDGALVGIEVESASVIATTTRWLKAGLRVEYTTADDAVRTWREAFGDPTG